MTLEELQTLLEELFPVGGELSSMQLGDSPAVHCQPAGPKEREAGLRLTLRLVTWERNPESGALSIRDVKEQQCYLGPVSLLQRGDRLTAFFRGICDALKTILEAEPDTAALMPYELWRPDILRLVRAQTADDFCRAALVPSRLGRYLPNSATSTAKKSPR